MAQIHSHILHHSADFSPFVPLAAAQLGIQRMDFAAVAPGGRADQAARQRCKPRAGDEDVPSSLQMRLQLGLDLEWSELERRANDDQLIAPQHPRRYVS